VSAAGRPAGSTALQAVPCPLCGEAPGEVVVREGGFQACRCPGCGLVFVSPRPSPDEILAIYEHDASQTAARLHIAKTRQPYALAHARFTLDLIARHRGPGDLLELGAGGGLFLDLARARGHRVAAIEPNPVLAAFLRDEAGLPCETRPLGPDSFDGARFDIVYHCNVLSHLSDPLGAVQDMGRALRPGGLLVLETGNFADVDPRYHALIARTERFQLPEHLAFFGEPSLRRLLASTGFELRALHRFSRVAEKRGPAWLGALGLRRILPRVRFSLTYRLGRVLPKRGRPQTVILVAARV